MKILGIETSADDTGVTLIDANGSFGPDFHYSILSHAVSTQTIHAGYGGIFPAMAKREHAANLPLLFERVMAESKVDKIDAIAVTYGPGLEPCLWTGITFAQKLAEKWSTPIVATNHMEGHIVMAMMNGQRLAAFEFPALSLLISGGHTQLVLSGRFQQYKIVGNSRDDAVGEAYDKVARMLDLPYPGGPHISKLAEEARAADMRSEIKLPRPMIHEDNFDFSFSGLKTAVLRATENKQLSSDEKMTLAREFEDAAAEVIAVKTTRAIEEFGVATLVVGGGVSANTNIRRELTKAAEEAGAKILLCEPKYSGDNALMIALAGYFHALNREFNPPADLKANGSLKLS